MRHFTFEAVPTNSPGLACRCNVVISTSGHVPETKVAAWLLSVNHILQPGEGP
jgi:hypothetical protein